VVSYGRTGVAHQVGRPLLGFALLERLLHLAHHRLLDLIEVDFDGFTAGMRLGPGRRHLFGLGPSDGRSRRDRDMAFQRIDQAVERRIR